MLRGLFFILQGEVGAVVCSAALLAGQSAARDQARHVKDVDVLVGAAIGGVGFWQ